MFSFPAQRATILLCFTHFLFVWGVVWLIEERLTSEKRERVMRISTPWQFKKKNTTNNLHIRITRRKLSRNLFLSLTATLYTLHGYTRTIRKQKDEERRHLIKKALLSLSYKLLCIVSINDIEIMWTHATFLTNMEMLFLKRLKKRIRDLLYDVTIFTERTSGDVTDPFFIFIANSLLLQKTHTSPVISLSFFERNSSGSLLLQKYGISQSSQM